MSPKGYHGEMNSEGTLERKVCRNCAKPFEYLRVERRTWRVVCDDCRSLSKKNHERNTNRGLAKKRRNLAYNYGMKMTEYDSMVEACGGVCQSCGSPPAEEGSFSQCNLNVDHDHATGRVRGLLCSGCNLALGLLGEDVDRLKGLISYLNEQGVSQSETENGRS